MLLRHAKSKKAQGGMSDHARRLKGRGKSDAPVIGAYMSRHELVPDLVLVSTAERARQTWERLATVLPARFQSDPLATCSVLLRASRNDSARISPAPPQMRQMM